MKGISNFPTCIAAVFLLGMTAAAKDKTLFNRKDLTGWDSALMCQFMDNDARQSASSGVIALQMHPGPPMKVQFRNILLKELK